MERKVSNSSHIDYTVLQQHFHLPISQVAKELGVCATVLKKLCRQHGIPRWPHRKIKSLNKMIATLEETITETEEDERQRIAELTALQRKKKEIIENPGIIGPTYSHINPRNEGRPGSAISKYTRSSNPEIAMREQNVIAMLHKQRKFSAPPSGTYSYNVRMNFGNTTPPPPSVRSLHRSDNNFPQAMSSPPCRVNSVTSVRSSSPAVLEGISQHQIQSLYSAYKMKTHEDSPSMQSMDPEKEFRGQEFSPQVESNQPSQTLPLKYPDPPMNFNYAPPSRYQSVEPEMRSRSPFGPSHGRYPDSHNPSSYIGYPPTPSSVPYHSHQIFSYPQYEEQRNQSQNKLNFTSGSVNPDNHHQQQNNNCSRFEFVPQDFPPPNSRMTFTSYPNA